MPKHPGGRPSKYEDQHCADIIRFFSVAKNKQIVKSVTTGKNEYEKTEYTTVPNDLPTFAGFARKIGVNGDTVVEWTKKNAEFSAAYNVAKELQKEFLVDNGLKGLYPPASFIFVAKNVTTMRDKQEVESTKRFDVTGLGNLTDEQLDDFIKGLQNRVSDRTTREGTATV